MRALRLAIGLALLCLALQFSGAFAASPAAGIGAAINSTAQYLARVNESAYLVFYPNLSYAYNALDRAANVSRSNPAEAYSLLDLARSSALAEQQRISQYRQASFYALAAVSAALALTLYALMRKPGKRR